jgi:hypothetical protein
MKTRDVRRRRLEWYHSNGAYIDYEKSEGMMQKECPMLRMWKRIWYTMYWVSPCIRHHGLMKARIQQVSFTKFLIEKVISHNSRIITYFVGIKHNSSHYLLMAWSRIRRKLSNFAENAGELSSVQVNEVKFSTEKFLLRKCQCNKNLIWTTL